MPTARRTVRPQLPATGSTFLDARGGDRALRVSWHAESGVVVLSLWRGNVCTGTFRVDAEDVPLLIAGLRTGPRSEGYADPTDERRTG